MLTRGPFWPLRRVDASFLHLEYSLFEVYTLNRLECNKKRRVAVGPPHSFSSAPHISYISFPGIREASQHIHIYFTIFKNFTQYFAYSSKIVCYLRVTYLLPTNYFLLLLKATKKPFNRAFCFKHSTFKLTFRELWSTTSCFKTVLREFLSCFSLIFRAFPAFGFSVIRYADHKKRPFFIQR